MIGFIAAAVGVGIGYEVWKKKQLLAGKTLDVIPGHEFNIAFTGAPSTPPTQAQIQQALNASAPGLWDVVQDGQAGFMPGTFNFAAVYAGPSATKVSAASLTSGWAKPNSLVFESIQDVGAAPQHPANAA